MSINHCFSNFLPVLSGVPEGSILGPLLFLIFINDLPSSVKHSSLFLFADDAKCLKTVCSLPDCHQLQYDLLQLAEWSLHWNLHFNENKYVIMRFCATYPCVNFDYRINNIPIKAVESHQDLGIVMSYNLKWVHHLKYISSKAYNVLEFIHRAFPSSDLQIKKNLYLLLVHFQLSYGSQIWRPNLLKDITAL